MSRVWRQRRGAWLVPTLLASVAGTLAVGTGLGVGVGLAVGLVAGADWQLLHRERDITLRLLLPIFLLSGSASTLAWSDAPLSAIGLQAIAAYWAAVIASVVLTERFLRSRETSRARRPHPLPS